MPTDFSILSQKLAITAGDVMRVLAVGQKPSLSFKRFNEMSGADVKENANGHLIFMGKFGGSFDGRFLAVLPENFAMEIAYSMMGGKRNKIFGAVEISAVFELMNNIMGRWASEFGEIINGDILIEKQDLVHAHAIDIKVDERWGSFSMNCLIGDVIYEMMIFIPRSDIEIINNGIEKKLVTSREVKMTEEKMNEHKGAFAESESTDETKKAESAKITQPARPKPHTPPVIATKATFEQLSDETGGDVSERPIDLLLDVPLLISVELGRKELSIKDILELAPGSIVELDQLAGEPVDLMVNGKLFAKGEVVVIDENFGIRITTIISPQERIERMR